MDQPPFDATEAVTFDLAFGHVHLDGAPNRVLVPSEALMDLCLAAGEEPTAALAHAIGAAMAKRVLARLGKGAGERAQAVAQLPLDGVVEHVAGELALLGLGSLGAERWGKALVLVHDQSPFGERGDVLVSQILQAVMLGLGAQAARVVRLERNGTRARHLLVSSAAVEGVRMRLRDGQSWGEVLAKLHRQPASS